MAEETILLIEDTPDDVTQFLRCLAISGFKTPLTAVGNGRDALAYLAGTGKFADRKRYPFPTIAFVDLNLPGEDGLKLIKSIKRRYPQLKQVVVSGRDDVRTVRECYAAGIASFLAKPLQPADLRNALVYFDSTLPHQGATSPRLSPGASA